MRRACIASAGCAIPPLRLPRHCRPSHPPRQPPDATFPARTPGPGPLRPRLHCRDGGARQRLDRQLGGGFEPRLPQGRALRQPVLWWVPWSPIYFCKDKHSRCACSVVTVLKPPQTAVKPASSSKIRYRCVAAAASGCLRRWRSQRVSRGPHLDSQTHRRAPRTANAHACARCRLEHGSGHPRIQVRRRRRGRPQQRQLPGLVILFRPPLSGRCACVMTLPSSRKADAA
jgi:hypothetical protein